MKITVDMIMSHDPCDDYPIEIVEELWGNREYLSLTEICDLDIPIPYKIWACSRFLSEQSCRLFTCDCAESVLHVWSAKYPDDNRLAETIRISRLYANFEVTKEQLYAARHGARRAACDALFDRAYRASDAADAVWIATWSTSKDAVRSSMWCSAKAASISSDWNVEYEKHLEFIRKYCELED